MMERLLRNNNVVRLIAFFLAFVFWAYVTGDSRDIEIQEITRPYTSVALEWLNLDEELEIVQIPEEIDVVLMGKPNLLNGITPQTLRIFVDLRDLGPGQHRLTPIADVPNGVRVISFTPQQVLVVLEEVQSSQMTVDIDIMGKPVDGFIVGDPRVTPNKVFIRGARSNLLKVDRVRAIVNVDGAESSLTQIVPVHAVDASGQIVEGVTVTPALVEVAIPVNRPQKEVPVHLNVTGEPAVGYRIEQFNLNPAKVTIEGSINAIKEITEILTTAVDITGATNTITTTISLADPEEGITILHAGQVQVEIIITPQ